MRDRATFERQAAEFKVVPPGYRVTDYRYRQTTSESLWTQKGIEVGGPSEINQAVFQWTSIRNLMRAPIPSEPNGAGGAQCTYSYE